MKRLCVCKKETCSIPYGRCHCECDSEVNFAKNSLLPNIWIKGHSHSRQHQHVLSDIDEKNYSATCVLCGEVNIKKCTDRKCGWVCIRTKKMNHRLVDIDEMARTAHCTFCKTKVKINKKDSGCGWVCRAVKQKWEQTDRSKEGHKEKTDAYNKVYQSLPQNRLNARDKQLRKKYGITLKQFNQMVKDQHGLCKICEGPPQPFRSLDVDHCHETGVIRGLLNSDCNIGIGKFNHDPFLMIEAAIYLLRFTNPALEEQLRSFFESATI